MAFSIARSLLVLLVFFQYAWAQSIITITVGATGSFFDPAAVIARKGDTVSFKWTGAFHSVTQSSFDNPCTPLQGGFDSGVTGNTPGQPLVVPTWNLTITDDSQPIWFFCKVTRPTPHCISGMVGAINANPQGTNDSFDQFLASAKSLTAIPPIPTGLPPALTGVGAIAAGTPAPSINTTNTTTTSSSTSTSSTPTSATLDSATITPTNTAPPVATVSPGLSTGAKAGIAGGIAGAAVLTALIILVFLQFRRAARYRKEAEVASKAFSHEKPAPLEPDFPYTPSYDRYIVRQPRAPGSASGISIPESVDPESTTSAVNVKELAAEIVKNIRQEAITNGGRMPMPGLESVPEHVIENSIARGMGGGGTATSYASQGESSSRGGGSSSTRSGVAAQSRQLPMPPGPPMPHNNPRFSMETLPAYQ